MTVTLIRNRGVCRNTMKDNVVTAYLDHVHDYYSERLWAVMLHVLFTVITGGAWPVGWFGLGLILFWLGFEGDYEQEDNE